MVLGAERVDFVKEGRPLAVSEVGRAWTRQADYMECSGTGNFLYASRMIREGDFHLTVRLSLNELNRTAASFVMDGNHFGFDGGDNRLFVEGPGFGITRFLQAAGPLITPDKPFLFEVRRTGQALTCAIDGHTVWMTPFAGGPVNQIALRPWRATMRVYEFYGIGDFGELPLAHMMTDSFSIPTIDLSGEIHRQVVVARGTAQVYQGHPTTLLLPDGMTMFATWTYNHGGACGPLKKSTDGGLTWSDLLAVPDNWQTVRNCPCIHRIVGPDGVERLFVFAGNGDMYQSASLDRGRTWSPMQPNGLQCVVAPISILAVEEGRKWLMWYHRGRSGLAESRDRSQVGIYQSASVDGGLTWGDTKVICEVPGTHPCEPAVICSPDGHQLLCLMRENTRRCNSLMMTSDDEGRTWSRARELPASLTGDRHCPRYAPDGRLVIPFRDQAKGSPTRGDFVAWVGTYEDVVNLREGQYRVRLLNSPKKFDMGYSGLELLGDGTLVATTYAVLQEGEKNSVVSVRFKLEEIDARAGQLPQKTNVYVSGRDGYHTYRIPALLATLKGTLLAFCEGRKDGRGDSGDIDMLVKRSSDNGKTWSTATVVRDDGANTCGNPCPVLDRETGTMWLLTTWNLGSDHERQIIDQTSKDTRRIFVSCSNDEGRTWSAFREITSDVKKPDWTWYATGPCTGIQLQHGLHKGRLIIPCDHIESSTKKYFSHIVYSDDHGKTWRLGGSTPTDQVNECQAVELTDGRLMLNMRNYDRSMRQRAVSISQDGGATWGPVRYDPALIEPICQASLIRSSQDGKEFLVFSNPASETARVNMTLRVSYDEGRSWPVARTLHAGPSAYSDLTALPDNAIGCLYECGEEHAYERITFARCSPAWLTNATDPLN
jgi:sialidase-1